MVGAADRDVTVSGERGLAGVVESVGVLRGEVGVVESVFAVGAGLVEAAPPPLRFEWNRSDARSNEQSCLLHTSIQYEKYCS